MNINILVVDDSHMNREVIKSIIERSLGDANILEAADGLEAMSILDKEEIGLLILDLMMPKMNGYEVLKELKTKDRLKDMPIIVNSARTDMESIKETLELGALDYFVKPLSQDEIEVVLPLKIKNAVTHYVKSKEIFELNARLKEDLSVARIIQQSMVTEDKVFDNCELRGKFIPSSELSGNYYSMVESGETKWFIIADVAGKGPAGAMVSSIVRTLFSEYANNTDKEKLPGFMLEDINKNLSAMFDDSLNIIVSAFIGMVEGDNFYYANAGYPYPLYFNAKNSKVDILEKSSFSLGLSDSVQYATEAIVMGKGDSIICYSNGLFVDRVKKIDKLYDFCVANKGMLEENRKEFLDNLYEELIVNSGKTQKEDLSLAIIHKK